MSAQLSNEDKVSIIQTHMKNLQYSKFNLEISVVEESAKKEPGDLAIASLNTQLDDIQKQLTALQQELDKVTP